VYHSAKFPTPPVSTVYEFLRRRTAGVVIAGGGESPETTLIPYVLTGSVDGPWTVTVHLVRDDATYRRIRAGDPAAVLVEEALAFLPHTVFDPRDSNRAMLLFREVLLQGPARAVEDPEAIAEALNRLAQFLEPGLPFDRVTAAGAYAPRIGQIAVVEWQVERWQAKWKLAQNEPPAVRQAIVDFLSRRGQPIDQLTVDVLKDYWRELGLDEG
jgi:predicted FMN-binding regulatory protein PaiB